MKLTSYIESILDEVFIFSMYLNLSTSIIEDSLLNGTKIHSPLRTDRKPSSAFKYKKGKIVLTDYASPEHSGDIYAVVGKVLNLNCNKSDDFIIICEDIINKLIVDKNVLSTYKPTKVTPSHAFKDADTTKFTSITVEYGNWDNETFVYWYDYVRPNKVMGKILIEQLQKYDIYPIEKYWLNANVRASRVYKKDEPLYAFLLDIRDGKRYYKIYAPNSKTKFITNGIDTFNYLDRTKVTTYCVIVKSIKDAILLNTTAIYLNIQDISFIAVSSESAIITKADYDKLKVKHDFIFSFYDWDKTGFLNAFKNAVKFGIEPIFITNTTFNPRDMNTADAKFTVEALAKETGYKITIVHLIDFIDIYKIKRYTTKDYSDFMEKYGVERAIKLFETYVYLIKERVEAQLVE